MPRARPCGVRLEKDAGNTRLSYRLAPADQCGCEAPTGNMMRDVSLLASSSAIWRFVAVVSGGLPPSGDLCRCAYRLIRSKKNSACLAREARAELGGCGGLCYLSVPVLANCEAACSEARRRAPRSWCA